MTHQLLKALERQRQCLNELARISAEIADALTGKLAESEKALKGDCNEPVQTR
jgi:hypothetical protein